MSSMKKNEFTARLAAVADTGQAIANAQEVSLNAGEIQQYPWLLYTKFIVGTGACSLRANAFARSACRSRHVFKTALLSFPSLKAGRCTSRPLVCTTTSVLQMAFNRVCRSCKDITASLFLLQPWMRPAFAPLPFIYLLRAGFR